MAGAQRAALTKVAVYRGAKNISGEKALAAVAALGFSARFITADEIKAGRLGDFDAVVFPGGHSIRIGAAGERAVRTYLRAGGGLVGICAGCQFAARLRLLPVEHRIWRAAGIVDLRVVAHHPITAGYTVAGKHRSRATWVYSPRGRVRMRYANGGILVPQKAGVQVVVSYDEPGELGAVVAGRCGRGRVVLIGPHPESTAPATPGGADADRSQEPLQLFGQAVAFAAGKPPAGGRKSGQK